MLKSISVTNDLEKTMDIKLSEMDDSGLLLANIVGLGPGKAEIKMAEIVSLDGGMIVGGRLPIRNIILTFFFMFDPIIEDSRQRTYVYFPIKRRIRLEFHTDNRDVFIDGTVESNEPIIFSEQTGTQISVLCEDPYFKSVEETEVMFSGTKSQFMFPFSNPVGLKKLVMSQLIFRTEENVYYDGATDTGVIISIFCRGPVGTITIYQISTRQQITISKQKIIENSGAQLNTGDRLIISSIRGDRYVRLIRNGIITNVLNVLERGSDWLVLENGDNIFAFDADEGLQSLEISLAFNNLYEGV